MLVDFGFAYSEVLELDIFAFDAVVARVNVYQSNKAISDTWRVFVAAQGTNKEVKALTDAMTPKAATASAGIEELSRDFGGAGGR